MKKILKVIFMIVGILIVLISGLFTVYFFNLDMKLTVNVIAPLLDKIYDRRERKQYL